MKNFRGIKSLEVKDMGRINLLFGENNCGKSTLLEAIFVALSWSSPDVSLNVNRFREFYELNEISFLSLFFGFDPQNGPAEIEVNFENPKEIRKVRIEPIYGREAQAYGGEKVPKIQNILQEIGPQDRRLGPTMRTHRRADEPLWMSPANATMPTARHESTKNAFLTLSTPFSSSP